MELINNFANLSKILSEKFSLKKSEVSLYLLVLIQHTFRLAEAQYEEVLSTDYGSYLVGDEVLDRNIFRSIKDSGLINLKSLSEDETRPFTEYLIAEYLKSANFALPSSNFLSLIANLATESALELDILNNDEPLHNIELNIYIANIGAGDIIIKLLRNLESKGIFEVDCGVVGEEPNKILTFLTKLNSFAHNITAHLLINDSNPLENPFTNFGIGLAEAPQIAISIPPFTNVQQQDLQKLYKFIDSTEKIYFSELAYIELMLKRVSERGKVIAVVRNDFLSSKKSKIFREKYLKTENDWIEKIHALPKEFANSPVDVSVIVFNKTKIEKGFVIFDGSEDKFEKTKISIEEIFSNGVDLRVTRYAAKESKKVESILSKYPQDEVRKIKDLIVSSISGYNYSPKDRIVENSSETLPYVRVKDLSNNDKSLTLDISKVERKISPEKVTHKRTVINFPAVLVSKIAPKLKPIYFKFTNQPIVIGSDIIALKMKENIDVDYFLTQLHSQLVKVQVEMMSSGMTINRISKEDFLNIQIILPPLEGHQQLQIFEMRGVIEKKAKAEEKLAKAEEEIQQTEYDVIATISHNLSQKLGKIGDDYNTLIRRLKRGELKSSQKFNELFGDKEAFDKVVNRLNHNIEDANETMATTTRILQKNKVSVESVNILQFLKNEIINNFSGSNFELSIETKLKSLFVPIDRDALKDAIRNLIENAQKHGFKNAERKFHIVFEISKRFVSDGTEYASIIYKNDGESFPKGFSFDEFKRLGGRAGETKGTGLGGFWINKVVGLHKGKFNYIPVDINSSSPYKVMFEILLPLE